jgi:hypothetical protein
VTPTPLLQWHIGQLAYGLSEYTVPVGDAYALVSFTHDECELSTFCRNPLHPGPCKGWKKHLGQIAPGALHALEKIRYEKLEERRKARVKALQDAGLPVPKKLQTPIVYDPAKSQHISAGQADEALQQQIHTPIKAPTKADIEQKLEVKHAQAAEAAKPKVNAEAVAAAKKMVSNYSSPVDTKLSAFEALSKDDFDSMTPFHQGEIKKWLGDLYPFNPKLRPRVAATLATFTGDPKWKKAAEQAPYTDTMEKVAKYAQVGSKASATLSASLPQKIKTYDELTADEWKGLHPSEKKFVLGELDLAQTKLGKASGIKAKATKAKLEGYDSAQPGDKAIQKAGSPQVNTGTGGSPGGSAGEPITSLSQTLTKGDYKTILKAAHNFPEQHDDLDDKQKATLAHALQYMAQVGTPQQQEQAKTLLEKFGEPKPKVAPNAEKKVDQLLGGKDKLGDQLDQAFGPPSAKAPAGLGPDEKHALAAKQADSVTAIIGKATGVDVSKGKATLAVGLGGANAKNTLDTMAKSTAKNAINTHQLDVTPEEEKQLTAEITEAFHSGSGHTPFLDELIAEKNAYVPNEEGTGYEPDSVKKAVTSGNNKDMINALVKNPDQYKDLTPAEKTKLAGHLYSEKITGPLTTAVVADDLITKHNMPQPGDELSHALNHHVSNASVVEALEAHPEQYQHLGPSDKQTLASTLDAKYLVGNSTEVKQAVDLAEKHGINLPSYGKAKAAFGGAEVKQAYVPTAEQPPHVQSAIAIANGQKGWQTEKVKLAAYSELSDDEFKSLDPNTQTLIINGLKSGVVKFKDPKKKAASVALVNKFEKAQGGGAGAGGESHTITPAATEWAQPDALPNNSASGLSDSDAEKAAAFLHDSNVTLSGVQEGVSEDAAKTALKNIFLNADSVQHQQMAELTADALAKKIIDKGALEDSAQSHLANALASEIGAKFKGGDDDTPVYDAVKNYLKVADADGPNSGDVQDLALHDLAQAMSEYEDNLAKKGSSAGLPGLYQKLQKGLLDPAEASKWPEPSFDNPGDVAWGSQILSSMMTDALTGKNGLNLTKSQWKDFYGDPNYFPLKQALTKTYEDALHSGQEYPEGWHAKLHEIVYKVNQHGKITGKTMGWKSNSIAMSGWKAQEFWKQVGKELGTHAGGGHAPGKPNISLSGPNVLTTEQKGALVGSFKSMSQGFLLSDPPDKSFDSLLALTATYSGKQGFPQMSLGQVIDGIDEKHAANLGVTNAGLLKAKIEKYLATPAGAAHAKSATPSPKLMQELTGALPSDIQAPVGHKAQVLPGPGAFKSSKPSSDFHEISVESMKEHQEKQWIKHGKKWTTAHASALHSYTSNSGEINDYLREDSNKGSPILRKTVVMMQDAMTPVDRDLILHRGTGWEFLPKQFRSADAAKALIGKTFVDKGFTSTAVGTHSNFADDVKMIIEAPKGTHGAFVQIADQWGVNNKGSGVLTNYDGENELILPAGTTFQIMSVEGYGGQATVHVRVVTPK